MAKVVVVDLSTGIRTPIASTSAWGSQVKTCILNFDSTHYINNPVLIFSKV